MTFLLGDVPGVSVVAEGPCEAYVLKHSDLVGMLTQVCSRRGLAPKGCSYEGVRLWDEAAPPWAVRGVCGSWHVAPGQYSAHSPRHLPPSLLAPLSISPQDMVHAPAPSPSHTRHHPPGWMGGWRALTLTRTRTRTRTRTPILAGRADGGPALQDSRRDTLRPHRRGVVQDAHGGRREERQEAGAEDHLGRPVDLAQRLQVQAALRPAQGRGALAAHDVLDAQGEQRAQGHHRPVRRPLRLRGAPLLRLESLRLPQAAGARAHPHPSP